MTLKDPESYWKEIYDLFIKDNLSYAELSEMYNEKPSRIRGKFKKYKFPPKTREQITLCNRRIFKEKYGVENPFQLESVQGKIKETNLKIHGVENPSQSKKIKQKKADTCLRNFGQTHYLKSEQGKHNLIQSNITRYGVANASQSDEVKLKKEQTSLDKYGVANISQSDEVKLKKEQTSLDRRGVANVFMCEKVKEKIRETNLAIHGVEYISQCHDVRLKAQQTNIKRYGTPFYSQSDHYKHNYLPEMEVEKREHFYNTLKLKNLTPLTEYQGVFITSKDKKYLGWVRYNFRCDICNTRFSRNLTNAIQCPACNSQISRGQDSIYEYITEAVTSSTIAGSRTIISPQELDIYIPEKKIAFEYNGNYWHRQSVVGITYHRDKTEKCLLKGIKLYHIWEHEDSNKIKSLIYSVLGQTQHKYHARKLKVASLDHSQRQQFFDANHLHNDVKATFALGLVNDQNEIIQAISFRKNKGDLEIARFATKLNCQVRGGFSKLMKHSLNHIKENYPDIRKIITYCNRDWTPDYQDSVYFKYGFTLVGDSGPMLKYYNNGQAFSRERFQKHKLKDMFEDYDDSNVNDFLETKRIYAFYNSGNWKFELNT